MLSEVTSVSKVSEAFKIQNRCLQDILTHMACKLLAT